MKIALVSSEVTPFAKTGGLADVAGALPSEIAKLGADVAVFQPAYPSIRDCELPIRETDIRINVPMASRSIEARILKSHLPASDVPIYFIDQPDYFNRAGLYQQNGADYEDNCERFAFFVGRYWSRSSL